MHGVGLKAGGAPGSQAHGMEVEKFKASSRTHALQAEAGEGAGRWVREAHRYPGPGCVHAHSSYQLPQPPGAPRVRPLQGEIYHGQVCFKTVYYPGL